VVDGTASPYLVLAGLLSAGIIGIRDKLTLKEECCGAQGTAQMSERERVEKGITRQRPLDLESARRCLVEDRKIGELIGDDVVKTFVAVNKVSHWSVSCLFPEPDYFVGTGKCLAAGGRGRSCDPRATCRNVLISAFWFLLLLSQVITPCYSPCATHTVINRHENE